ncbi:uncharacterized protein M6B38_349775 [Iris pallida]|uniref:Uncharacterized protein n=1 Tax=Iris pallida TaxID=29817 RepID=A0AAX6GRJ0_IRIPA|nr:uncharacterized protein M6B38_349775 [Iris pallida]
MTSILPRPLQISTPFPSTLSSQPCKPHRLFPPHALDGDANPDSNEQEEDKAPATASDASFEGRLAQVRVKYRSGTGKKAEQRRLRKAGGGGGGEGSSKKKAVTLPPVPLREALTKEGLKVEFGFSPYSERLNGRLAALGLAALVLVEVGSGKGLLNFHAGPILFIQTYTVAAAAAVFIKYEKERISVWPKRLEPMSDSEASAVVKSD